MLTFGHVYLNQHFVTYDICVEVVDGRPCYVATLSSDPRVHARAGKPETAVAILMSYLGRLLA
jgi:hypothetical protein